MLAPIEEIFCEVDDFCNLFHMSQYKTLKDFYEKCALHHLKSYFPGLVSYQRFVELEPTTTAAFICYMRNLRGLKTGLYFIDSITIKSSQ